MLVGIMLCLFGCSVWLARCVGYVFKVLMECCV